MRSVRQPAPARRLLIAVVAAAMLVAAFGLAPAPAQAQAEDYEVLVVGKTTGFRHSSIDEATRAIIDLGEDNGFTVDVWDDRQPDLTLASTPFTSAEDLAKYAAIVFVSTVDGTNRSGPDDPKLLTDEEIAAFQGYIRDGGGFVGVHAATDSMHNVPWYSELTGGGARFRNHPAQQTAIMRVEDPTHPSTEMLPLAWERFDEWYNFTTNPREDVHVLITLDEDTYNPGFFGAMGDDHPLSWCQNFEGGRSWYEGAGHTEASYADPLFLEHLLGGIEWAAGVAGDAGDCRTFREVADTLGAVDANSRRAEVLLPKIQERFEAARAAELERDHATAAELLESAQGMAHAVDGDLANELRDLWEWQEEAAAATS